MKIPFLYYVPKNEKVIDGKNVNCDDTWYVYFAIWTGYGTENCKWMSDDNLGEYPNVISLDFIEDENKDIFKFDNEKDALLKMKELWGKVEIE